MYGKQLEPVNENLKSMLASVGSARHAQEKMLNHPKGLGSHYPRAMATLKNYTLNDVM